MQNSFTMVLNPMNILFNREPFTICYFATYVFMRSSKEACVTEMDAVQ